MQKKKPQDIILNIDTKKLREISPELAEVIEEAMAVKIHFEKKTPIREWPRILEKVHKTKIILTIGEAFAIAATMLKLAEENEKMKSGIGKIGDCFVGCDECKKKVERQIEIFDVFIAARTCPASRKGNGDE